MNLLAVICEYNPFHTGHAHLINEARARVAPDGVVGLMSGWFVQRAEPAVLPPHLRAKTAISGGMDAVLQMTTCHSIAAAPDFAANAVRTLATIPSVRYLAFGAEDDESVLRDIASVRLSEPPAFKEALNNALDKGAGYAAALSVAVCTTLQNERLPQDELKAILKKPNNILAIEYLIAIARYAPHVISVIVKRSGNDYHSEKSCGDFISATAARALLKRGDRTALAPYLPQETLQECISTYEAHPINEETFEALAVYALRTSVIDSCPDAGEGLERRLQTNAKKYITLSEIIAHTANKRSTNARIKRLTLQALLGIRERITCPTAKPIAVKESVADALLPLFSHFPLRNRDYAASEVLQNIAAIEQRAADVYALITNRQGNEFTDARLLTL
ncbi:MAG: nucleotidyltransferase family protein [Clostridiales bacterium]|nr:nucleotidyltransferase family protein [Clostridiales bacterium]